MAHPPKHLGGEADTTHIEREEVSRFFEWLEWIIGFAQFLLGLFFVWLNFGTPEVKKVISGANPDLIWKSALVIYFLSWLFGSRFDVRLQKSSYVSLGWSKQERKWSVPSVATLVILIIVAGALAWSEGDIRKFAVVLCAFVFVDHAAWCYFIYRSRRPISRSTKIYENQKEFMKLEKLKVVTGQLHGNWKWWRLCVGLPLTLLIIGFAFSDPVRLSLEKGVMLAGISSDQLDSLVSGFLVLGFVLSMRFGIG